MALKEIQVKTISELPTHKKASLKTQIGEDVFTQFSEVDALVEIKVASSIPHIEKIDPIEGTFSDKILNNVNGGAKTEDIFKY